MSVKRVTLRFSLVFLITGLIIICGSVISLISYYGAKNSIHSLINAMVYKISNQALEQTLSHLKPATTTSKLSTYLLEDFIDVKDRKKLLRYLHDTLVANDQFVNVYYGDVSGNFFMAKRTTENTYSLKSVIRKNKKTIISWEHQNPDLAKVFPNEIRTIDQGYDPRKRPWFKAAVKKKGLIWTNVYIFFSDKKPGITNAIPIFDKNEKLLGVLGIDIGIKNLSRFLGQLTIGKNGKAFILSENKKIVALPFKNGKNTQKIYEEIKLNGKTFYQLKTLEQIKDKELAYSFKAYQKEIAKNPELMGKDIDFSFSFKNKSYLARYNLLHDGNGLKWIIGTIIPEDDFMFMINRNNQYILFATIFLILLTAVVGSSISRNISTPLRVLSKEMEKVMQFDFSSKKEIRTNLYEVKTMDIAFQNMKKGLRSFSKYVPSNLVQRLIDVGEEAVLGGKNKNLTIFFSDIEDFTTISESLPPEKLVEFLSVYFGELSSIILEHEGTVDKYIGDAIMAFWGAPNTMEKHAEASCYAALNIQNRLSILSKKWKSENKPEFQTRIGINSGEVIVGNMGSDARMDYTVIGDKVNVASRLEGLNKLFRTKIIISDSTNDEVKDIFETRLLSYVVVKGKSTAIGIYELVGEKGKIDPHTLEFLAIYNQAMDFYKQKNWKKSMEMFKKTTEKKDFDKASLMFIEQCEKAIEFPPKSDADLFFIDRRK
ncbi:MAG: adenylate cyclase [bacterium]|jgi:adenylate cyclase